MQRTVLLLRVGQSSHLLLCAGVPTRGAQYLVFLISYVSLVSLSIKRVTWFSIISTLIVGGGTTSAVRVYSVAVRTAARVMRKIALSCACAWRKFSSI